jgi:hypothetical protein
VNYNTMTLEICAADCQGYTYFGIEYGGECKFFQTASFCHVNVANDVIGYCGYVFETGSTNATESDCSFLCPGNNLEYCGARDRLTSYVAG